MEKLGKVKTCYDETENYPFSPMISQRSRTMATSRSKSRKKGRCLAQKSYNEIDDSNPNTDREHRWSDSDQQRDPLTGNRRSEILYQMAKERSMEKRRDRDRGDV